MLSFWPSDAVMITTQASLVCGPRPRLPRALDRLRNGTWAWLLLPVSLGGTIALLAVLPGFGLAYAWVAAIGVPLLAAIAIGAWLRPLRGGAAPGAVAAAGGLLALAWAGHGLPAQAAAVALTALSCCTIAAWLATLAPSVMLRGALITMAILDAALVFGHLLEGPNETLNAAGVGNDLPHLQLAVFGSALVGYGDLFVAAVFGNILADPSARWPPRPLGAVLVLACSAAFDLLFFAVDELPATVPVAGALLLMEAWRRSPRAQSWARTAPRAAAQRR